MLDKPWLPPIGREARNEQRKLHGALFNALAITLLVAAFVGPFVNPVLEETLQLRDRILMAMSGWSVHLLVRYLVRDMEDK